MRKNKFLFVLLKLWTFRRRKVIHFSLFSLIVILVTAQNRTNTGCRKWSKTSLMQFFSACSCCLNGNRLTNCLCAITNKVSRFSISKVMNDSFGARVFCQPVQDQFYSSWVFWWPLKDFLKAESFFWYLCFDIFIIVML